VAACSPPCPLDSANTAGGLWSVLLSEPHTGDDGVAGAMKKDSTPWLGCRRPLAHHLPLSPSPVSLPSVGNNIARMSQFISFANPSLAPSGLLSLHSRMCWIWCRKRNLCQRQSSTPSRLIVFGGSGRESIYCKSRSAKILRR
jgi:hypothetical protein